MNFTAAYSSRNATVKEIRFRGNNTYPAAQLLNVMKLKPGLSFAPSIISEDVVSILSLYHQRGYCFADAVIDTLVYVADSSEVIVSILIDEGALLPVGEVRITGNTFISEADILERFQTKTGKYLSPLLLEQDFENLIRDYGRIGFPFTSVQIDYISLIQDEDGTSLSIVIEIEEGKRVTIDQIEVAGNAVTENEVIIRELRIKLHEFYNRDKIDRIANRLRRLAVFSRVEEPVVYSGDYGGGLVISVVEGKTNTIDGIVGYAPSLEGSGTFSGMVDIGMRNLFGTGRKIKVRWLKDERNSQEINLRYMEPWIFHFPLNISLGFDQRQQDSAYVRRGVSGQADILVDESLTLGGMLGQESIIPSGTNVRLMQSTNIFAGISIGYDTRDDILNPSRGTAYSTFYNIGRKKTAVERTTMQRAGVDLEFFFPLSGRQVIRLGLHGRTLSGEGIEAGELYRFGGTNTLRGYREYQFLGKDIAWTNAEYRFILTARSFIYGFLDTGYYLLPSDAGTKIPSVREYLIGYGVGIRLQTLIGNIGVSLGFGEGDSFLDGKVHLGIVNEF